MEIQDVENLINGLKDLGLTEHESKVYLALLTGSPATGYEASKVAGLPRANVYNVLESLTTKGWVQPLFEKPVQYLPISPEIILRKINIKISHTCEDLENQLKKITPAENKQNIWNIRGTEEITSQIQRMISKAKQRIAIKVTDVNLKPHISALRQAHNRGVEIIAVMFGTEFPDFGIIYIHEESGILVGESEKSIILTVDNNQVLIASLDDKPSGAYSKNNVLVGVANNLIRHDIYMTEMISHLGPQVEEIFGPSLINLRERFLSPELIAKLRARLNKE